MSDKFDQQNITSDLIRDLIRERRSEKRWKNIRFFIGFFLFLLIILLAFSNNSITSYGPNEGKGYVALIRLDGMIEPGREFSAESVLPKLKDAFSDARAKGVILDINSGGGTPVQASIIHDAILDMKKKYNKKVIVVGEDLMASGAYYVAVAGDKIYVNPNTITGSIGVIMKGFGFPELIKKIGVERRVYTAGVNKDRLDPFLPQNQEDLEKIRSVIDEVHTNFSQVVMQGRQGKLHADDKELFSGDFWSGQTALKLGLVDGLGNLTNVMHDEFKVSRYKDYSGTQGILKSVFSQMSLAFNMAMSGDDVKVLEKI